MPGIALTAADWAGLHRGRVAAPDGRRVPHPLAVGEAQREHAAALLRVGVGAVAVGQHDAADVRVGHVDVHAVGGRAPLHAAHRAALADARLPDDCAVAIGIERVHDARFLSRDERPAPVGHRHEDGRRPEVEVRAVGVGAVGLVGQAARGRIGVGRGHLPVPEDLARGEVQGHERVAHRRAGVAVVVARRDVDGVLDRVDGRRAPDRRARRTPESARRRRSSWSAWAPRPDRSSTRADRSPHRAPPGCRGTGSTRRWAPPPTLLHPRPRRRTAGRCRTSASC